eukprot:5028258-Amphidinium_carterae.2
MQDEAAPAESQGQEHGQQAEAVEGGNPLGRHASPTLEVSPHEVEVDKRAAIACFALCNLLQARLQEPDGRWSSKRETDEAEDSSGCRLWAAGCREAAGEDARKQSPRCGSQRWPGRLRWRSWIMDRQRR